MRLGDVCEIGISAALTAIFRDRGWAVWSAGRPHGRETDDR